MCLIAGGKCIGARAVAPSESKNAATHLPLCELAPRSGGIGPWLLLVADTPRVCDYECTWNGKRCKGKRFEINLLSPEAGSYCIGQYRRRGSANTADKQFDRNAQRSKVETMWCARKVSLVIDLNSTKMDPVLQSIYNMPP